MLVRRKCSSDEMCSSDEKCSSDENCPKGQKVKVIIKGPGRAKVARTEGEIFEQNWEPGSQNTKKKSSTFGNFYFSKILSALQP